VFAPTAILKLSSVPQLAHSATLVMNLLFVVGIFLMAYLACGGVLFEEGSLDARANYDHFVQGFITLFQSKFKGLITFFSEYSSKLFCKRMSESLSVVIFRALQCAVVLT
jgi:hypothetical protein